MPGAVLARGGDPPDPPLRCASPWGDPPDPPHALRAPRWYFADTPALAGHEGPARWPVTSASP